MQDSQSKHGLTANTLRTCLKLLSILIVGHCLAGAPAGHANHPMPVLK